MSPNPVGHFNAPLDVPNYDVPMDASSPASLSASESLDSSTFEDSGIQDDATLFNLDDNFNHPNPPQATLDNLAST